MAKKSAGIVKSPGSSSSRKRSKRPSQGMKRATLSRAAKEAAARRRAEQIMPTGEKLGRIVKSSSIPAEWWDETPPIEP